MKLLSSTLCLPSRVADLKPTYLQVLRATSYRLLRGRAASPTAIIGSLWAKLASFLTLELDTVHGGRPISQSQAASQTAR